MNKVNIKLEPATVENITVKIQDILIEKKVLQKRIDKAIKYIEEWQRFPYINEVIHEELRNLLDILKY